MAAMSMLLVSSILLVSSTYAWFTLSTAPEVSGITTSVGANGNLEIALLTTDTALDKKSIESTVGNSSAAQGATKANITWGNLIDLSDSAYGLSSIKLQPAELNTTPATDSAAEKVDAFILKTAVYGADGRVADLAANTVSATWGETTFTKNGTNQDYGVRAIGTTTQLNARQLGLITARSNISTYSTYANAKAANALNTYGSAIGNIAVTHALANSTTNESETTDAPQTAAEEDEEETGTTTETSTESYSQDEMDALEGFADALDLALDDVETAIRWTIVAYATTLVDSTENGDTTSGDALYTAAYNTVFDKDGNGEYKKSLNDLINDANYSGASTALSEIIGKFNTARNNVAGAKSNIPSEEGKKTSYTWTDITAVMTPLMKTENMTVNGVLISDAKTNSSAVIKNMVGNTIVLDMPSGSGVCADIADFVGTYSGKVEIDLPVLGPETTTMTASTTKETTYLDAALAATKSITAGSTSNTATVNLSDTYGYVLDFAFRTNASSSNLQLQTAEAQRVYSDSKATNTQGSGSYMEFDGSVSGLDIEDMVDLMKAIRVVFVDLSTSEILGRAKLDLDTTTDDANKTTTNYTVTGTTVKANLYLYTTSTVETEEEGNTTKVTTETLSKTDSEICALTQNTVRKVSVIVYLDGNMVNNTMVANAASSMTGSMNLQFSSSATLVPMQNTSLYEGSASEAATTTAAANNDGN
jgi:hypothetical protein